MKPLPKTALVIAGGKGSSWRPCGLSDCGRYVFLKQRFRVRAFSVGTGEAAEGDGQIVSGSLVKIQDAAKKRQSVGGL